MAEETKVFLFTSSKSRDYAYAKYETEIKIESTLTHQLALVAESFVILSSLLKTVWIKKDIRAISESIGATNCFYTGNECSTLAIVICRGILSDLRQPPVINHKLNHGALRRTAKYSKRKIWNWSQSSDTKLRVISPPKTRNINLWSSHICRSRQAHHSSCLINKLRRLYLACASHAIVRMKVLAWVY